MTGAAHDPPNEVTLANELEIERQRLAREIAYERGKEVAHIEARLNEHDRHFVSINGSMDKAASRIEALAYQLQRIESSQERRDAVADALTKAVESASKSQVTTRTFLLGLGGLLIALISALVAIFG